MSITVNINGHNDDCLNVVWRERGEFPAYQIWKRPVLDASVRLRSRLAELVKAGVERRLGEIAPTLAELAAAGRDLYESLFDGPARNMDVARKVRGWLEPRTDRAPMSFLVDHRIHVPWGLAFGGEISEIPAGAVEVEHFERFWCLEHRLSTFYNPITPDQGVRRAADSFRLLPVINRKCLEDAIASMPEAEGRALRSFLETVGEPAYSLREFEESWRRLSRAVGLMYFFCHANGVRLQIANNELIDRRFFLSTRPKEFIRDSPGCVVFLNGCSTAIASGGTGGFMDTLAQEGFSGFIGTETEVPDLFALRFGSAFLYELLHNDLPVDRVMEKLRRQHWPLSLVYNTYCHPELAVEPHPAKSDLADLLGRNFSREAVGRRPWPSEG